MTGNAESNHGITGEQLGSKNMNQESFLKEND